MSEERNDIYSLEDLILRLEKIRDDFHGNINFPKAFYSLALEIKSIKERLDKKEK